jgi:predicted dehydrogenase
MAEQIRVGVIGAGWPGTAHAKGYAEAGGFKLVAVADLIPSRRQSLMRDHGITKEFADANDLLADKEIDAVSICLPNYLHAPIALAALKSGKHVMIEKPPAMNAGEAKKIQSAAERAKKIVMYSVQRRFGPFEQAAKQAIAKGYAGDVYHARASYTRTRGIPLGTGWFTDKSKSGGGALIDIGIHMLDLAWYLMGQPRPTSVFGTVYQRFGNLVPQDHICNCDDAAFALIRFEGGKSIELATSWAINQPPHQEGTVCRMYGSDGAVDVYTSQGAVLYRNFKQGEPPKSTPLKQPKLIGHAALMRHFKECIQGKATPIIGAVEGVQLMQILDGIYKSSDTGKSVEIK